MSKTSLSYKCVFSPWFGNCQILNKVCLLPPHAFKSDLDGTMTSSRLTTTGCLVFVCQLFSAKLDRKTLPHTLNMNHVISIKQHIQTERQWQWTYWGCSSWITGLLFVRMFCSVTEPKNFRFFSTFQSEKTHIEITICNQQDKRLRTPKKQNKQTYLCLIPDCICSPNLLGTPE